MPSTPPLAGYPAPVRRALVWYDGLTDRQRIEYALAAIFFLLASGGYLLGLGSVMLVQRVDSQSAALAAEAAPTEAVAAEPTLLVVAVGSVGPTDTPTPQPVATEAQPTPRPSPTPFNAPEIAEPPAAPRTLPAAPAVIAPAAPVRAAPTASRPRNLETSEPEPPAASVATPTRGVVRTPVTSPPTAVRQVAPPTLATSRGASLSGANAAPTVAATSNQTAPANAAPTAALSIPAATPTALLRPPAPGAIPTRTPTH